MKRPFDNLFFHALAVDMQIKSFEDANICHKLYEFDPRPYFLQKFYRVPETKVIDQAFYGKNGGFPTILLKLELDNSSNNLHNYVMTYSDHWYLTYLKDEEYEYILANLF